MEISIVDNDVLTPIYACGKRGESIDVQLHGTTYTVWKILDDLDKHMGKSPKIACKICHGDQAAFDKLIAAMRDMGTAAKTASKAITDFAEHFKFKKDKGTK